MMWIYSLFLAAALVQTNGFVYRQGMTVLGRTLGKEHQISSTNTNRDSETDDRSVVASDDGHHKDNKAMSFLRKIGKVGGAANQDFLSAVGVDEGPSGKSTGGGKPVRKAKSAYQSCVDSGIIDDMSQDFPFTSSGTQWSGFTDRVMGGVSSGSITRELVVAAVGSRSSTDVDYDLDTDGSMDDDVAKNVMANVMRGTVSLANNGGFIQMATDLSLDPSVSPFVDASDYDGIELDVLYQDPYEDDEMEGEEASSKIAPEHFNIHLKNAASQRQFSSYRATFQMDNGADVWHTIRVPWSEFHGHGPGCSEAPFDFSTLRRIGLVAIGREMKVHLALAGLRFYSVI